MADRELSTMTVDLRSGDALALAGVRVEFVHKSGKQARLRVTAPRELPIQKIIHDEASGEDIARAKHGFIRT